MNPPDSLRAAVDRIDSLPAMPRVAQEIMALPLDTDAGERELLALIGTDPQISARVIGLANAPLFGAAKKITSVGDATMLLGINRVKALVMGIAVMSTMTRKPAGMFSTHELWLHSLACALAMRTIAHAMPEHSRPPDEELFFVGLLHDIGFMVLDHLDPELSDAFHQRVAAEPELPVAEIEAEMLELNHAELGAALARHWDLPEHIVVALHFHHRPDEAHAAASRPLAAIAALAERLLPEFGIAVQAIPEIADAEWQALGIEPARTAEILDAVQEHVREVAASFD